MMIFLLLLMLALLAYGIWEYFKGIKETSLDVTRFAIPAALKGKRIVFVSDMQFDHSFYFLRKHSQRLCQKVADLKADLLIFGGDIIHSKNRYNQEVLDLWSSIKADKIAVLGNHDRANEALVRRIYQERGVTLLVNEGITLFDTRIIGIDDTRTGQPACFDLSDQRFTILLSHDPDYFETIENWNGFGLSGHLHKGQINFFGYALILPSAYGQKYQYGWVEEKVYVSSGLGGWVFFLPLRINAKPEILIIDF